MRRELFKIDAKIAQLKALRCIKYIELFFIKVREKIVLTIFDISMGFSLLLVLFQVKAIRKEAEGKINALKNIEKVCKRNADKKARGNAK